MIYIILFLLICGSAFFSSLETGLLSLGEINIRNWSRKRITSLTEWLKNPADIIAGILIGNNFVNIIFSAIVTVLLTRLVQTHGFPLNWVETTSIVSSSFMILVLGEIIPKTFANTHPDKIVSRFYPLFIKFYFLIKIIIKGLNRLAFSIAGSRRKADKKTVSRKELRLALENMERNGHMEKDFSRMMGKVLFLNQKSVGQVMIPRKKIYGVNLNWKYGKIMKKLLDSKFSRIPAYKKNLDNIEGFIYIKDVIGELNHFDKLNFEKIIRKPHITRDTDRTCQSLFQELRKKRIHCSLVKENGRLLGLVAVEDLIEEIVGEIYDEYDIN
ncbi:MAG: hemolysin family protein [Elusimicrobiota bacterium]